MTNVKYSVLLCNVDLNEYADHIYQWLSTGIKVIWFGKDEDVALIKSKHKEFYDAHILQAYSINDNCQGIIVDGKDTQGIFNNVSKACPKFNSAQYAVEHCNSKEHIIVQASAGTGKTTVMIDRILYLLHTDPNLNLSEVYMITFTNEAADQMSKKLQDMLLLRYKLTKKQKYLKWLEEQTQMRISTIHSFAYYMLKEYGISESFTKNLSIRSLQYEKKELIKNTIDLIIDENTDVKSQLGVPFYRANSIVNDFWSEFSKLGIDHNVVKDMNWGKPIDTYSESFQNIMSGIVDQLEEQYSDIKRVNEAVAIDDIMRDLLAVLQRKELPQTDVSMKYIFIDEFQDSDLAQIKVACFLIKLFNSSLFVVGDIKQSIYRFRGATDIAFETLRSDMKNLKIPAAKEFILVNNYRTSAEVLYRMDKYFHAWGTMGMLKYDKAVIPFNETDGKMKMLHMNAKDDIEKRITDVISKELNDLVGKVENGDIKKTDKARVVVLTRTNNELKKISSLLRINKIPATVKQSGSFYSSEAVRDFYIMVSSFLFCDEPKHIFNFLLTPYAGEIEPLNIRDMEWLHGDYDNLVTYLDRFLNQTTWKKYHKDFRLRPVLSVLKEIVDSVPIIDNFILNTKARLRSDGWEDSRCNASTLTKARQYQANLEKLLSLLQSNLGGEKVSLYDVYKFLKLNIVSNRAEEEAEIENTDDYTSVLCMTVHKSKGLEFETVILPYTSRSFPGRENTELIIDPIKKKVGWNYTGDKEKNKQFKYHEMKNSLYDEMKREDVVATSKEEARILYVAMTRAISNLICIVPSSKKTNTWAHLIEEVGVDYE